MVNQDAFSHSCDGTSVVSDFSVEQCDTVCVIGGDISRDSQFFSTFLSLLFRNVKEKKVEVVKNVDSFSKIIDLFTKHLKKGSST